VGFFINSKNEIEIPFDYVLYPLYNSLIFNSHTSSSLNLKESSHMRLTGKKSSQKINKKARNKFKGKDDVNIKIALQETIFKFTTRTEKNSNLIYTVSSDQFKDQKSVQIYRRHSPIYACLHKFKRQIIFFKFSPHTLPSSSHATSTPFSCQFPLTSLSLVPRRL